MMMRPALASQLPDDFDKRSKEKKTKANNFVLFSP